MPKKPPAKPIHKAQLSARAQAWGLLATMLGEGRTLDEALHNHPLRGGEADQRFAMLLALTTVQHLGQLDALLAGYLDKPLPPKRLPITNALRMGLAQLLLLDTPPHAAVNETVELVKTSKDGGLAGLVNAILQKAARERPTLPDAVVNLPAWLRARWEAAYGADTVRAMAAVAMQRPPLDINSATDMDGATRLDAHMLRMDAAHDAVETLAGYGEGAFFIQDLAASYPVRLLGDVRELQVLDLCAAPGGKAMQLARAGGFVTALDRSPGRMKRLKENMARLQLGVNVVTGDVLEWQPNRAYDAILLDAPCTATGTWRRHPEVVQILDENDIAELAKLQRRMLERAWGFLKPGGKLVYCVCSLEPEEGEAQAAWFLGAQADAALVPVDAASEIPAECITSGMLRTLPSHLAERGGMDGFFAVCFLKR
ncbi:MAG: transcription antitermination factor NusB [Pseudomonadota bacterium]